MKGRFGAVIFDMDGVLINSEQLWRKAMIRGFAEFEMQLSEDDCRKTMGMRFREVISLWLSQFRLPHPVEKIESRVLELLLQLIAEEGEAIESIPEIIRHCKSRGLKLGVATSSSTLLVNAVMQKLNMETTFHAIVSAEHLPYGKPHPEVFLECARQLGLPPQHCIVIEDSLNGVIAAKAAQMSVIAVPDDEHTKMQQFAVADYKMNRMNEVLALFKGMF